jgi:hypothetical protein
LSFAGLLQAEEGHVAETSEVRIVAVPEAPLRLSHGFSDDPPLPVALRFGDTVLPVRLATGDRPLSVDMRAILSAGRALPLCLSLCEAICADSDYRIEITLFDRPVMTIRLRGRTRLYSEKS